MADGEILAMAAAELLSAYEARRLSPVEVARACLAQVARLDGRFGAFCLVDEEGALAAARASEARWAAGAPCGPLDGVPATIKDILWATGWPTHRGSRTTDGVAAEAADAPSVRLMREAGAMFLGKTTTPEIGWKAVTDNPRGDVARNPHDPKMTAGGSSGGAAVAAALGMGVLHFGTDGGGSIRIPSSFCGIAGIKPTFGRVPAFPLSPFGTVAHVGPMARSVADCALMLEVMAQPDSADWHVLPKAADGYRGGLAAGVAGLRIAVSPTLGFVDVDPEVRGLFDEAAEAFEGLGAHLELIDPPVGRPRALFDTLWYVGAANAVARVPEERRRLMEAGLLEVAAAGEAYSARQVRDAALERDALGSAMQRFFDRFDLLLTPATAIPAFEAMHEVPSASGLSRWVDWAGFSYPFNLTQQPAMSLPCGRTAAGLPVGLQIIGPKYADALVLRAAAAFERAEPWPLLAKAALG